MQGVAAKNDASCDGHQCADRAPRQYPHDRQPIAALFAVTAADPSVAQTSATDEARIRAIVDEQVTAWNAGDAVAFSKSVGEQESFTNIRGTVCYGHKAFEDRHREIFDGFWRVESYHNVDVKES